VAALANADRIAASGCGHSGIACQHFAHSLCCIERPARFLSPAEAVHGASGFLQEGDVIVLASRGGKTAELLPILRICRQKGVTAIGITEDVGSPLALGSDIVLRMHVEREADRYNSQGTTSFVVLSAIFDALAVALLDETGYREEQFALIHPGGAVGERLNRA
jgi:D-arabinose 5-phosphate isomerase GutQ